MSATWDSLKLARDGHVGYGVKPPPFGFIRPVWDRLVVAEWNAEGFPIRWYEEMRDGGAVEFSGFLRDRWLARVIVNPDGIEREHLPTNSEPEKAGPIRSPEGAA